MNLVWKLLRQHISVPQFAGFFFANLFGMLIVLLGFQFYHDVVPIFTAEDSFMKSDFMIVNKKIGTASSISGRSNTFSNSEIDDIGQQSFSDKIGKFTSTEYKVDANMSVNGVPVLDNGEISFESVPDNFVEVKQLSDWKYTPGSKIVPIILPRIYLTMYNFGFAQSHSLPKISDGLIGMIDFQIFVHGNKKQAQFKGKVIGFSSRLSSILVPQAFMDWSNNEYAPGQQTEPTRLIMSLKNPGDQNFTKYLDKKGYEIENDKLNAEKTTYFLKMMVTMVMVVGLIISILSFYILMLSIYLLVQKNSSKLENLLLIGYSPGHVAHPYQLLTISLNIAVLIMAWIILFFVRNYYMGIIETLFPDIEDGTMLPTFIVGISLLLLVSICNLFAIRNKIASIWKRKE
ncbi:MAG: ABC transporter permease [Prevotella sp.]